MDEAVTHGRRSFSRKTDAEILESDQWRHARRKAFLARVFGLNIQPEMLTLWLFETSGGFLTFYTLLNRPGYLPEHAVGIITPSVLVVIDAMLMALTVGLVGVATGLYRPQTCLAARLILLKAAVSGVLSLFAVWGVAKSASIQIPLPNSGWAGWPLALLAGWISLILGTRLLYGAAARMNLFVRRVAVLGVPSVVAETVAAINGVRQPLYRFEAIEIPTAPRAARTEARVQLPEGLWGIVVAGAVPVIDVPGNVRTFDVETFWESQLGRVELASLPPPGRAGRGGDVVSAAAARWVPALVRRLLDVVVASLLLLFTAPLLLMAAVAIRLESPGPVIYRQERVGLGGRTFTLWKLRSMRQDAERQGPRWAAAGDPRVTTVGRLIRQVRIDELPQLVNILRGDMSLIGPRPERPVFVDQLVREIPSYRRRHAVKPGLTGWAQVSYPYGASVEDARAKLSYDLFYVKHRSLLFDLMILLSTVRVVLFQEGAR